MTELEMIAAEFVEVGAFESGDTRMIEMADTPEALQTAVEDAISATLSAIAESTVKVSLVLLDEPEGQSVLTYPPRIAENSAA